MNFIRSLLILIIAVISAAQAHRDVKRRGKQDFCSAEKAQARCVKIVQEWSSFVNTGNLQFLVNNYIQVGASLTVTGAVNTNTCSVVTTDLAQALTADIEAQIKGDVLTIKEVKYLPKSGNVEVHFTSLQGVDGAEMTLVDNKWLFKSLSGCDYRVNSQTNIFFPCL